MPTAPLLACPCGGRRAAGQACAKCGKGGKREARKRYDEQRGSSSERGYDGYWDTVKEAYLQEHMLCVCCEARGIVTGARGRKGVRVDHIVPKRIAPDLFYEPTNWQTLCLDCDLRHKQPLEKRCTTAEQVLRGWAEVMERMRK